MQKRIADIKLNLNGTLSNNHKSFSIRFYGCNPCEVTYHSVNIVETLMRANNIISINRTQIDAYIRDGYLKSSLFDVESYRMSMTIFFKRRNFTDEKRTKIYINIVRTFLISYLKSRQYNVTKVEGLKS